MPPEITTSLYEEIRAQIQHEDTLVTQRLNWFLTSQSFLFTAFAIVFNGSPPAAGSEVRKLLLAAIPLLAIIAGILIFLSIVAGTLVMSDLRRFYRKRASEAEMQRLPPIQGFGYTRLLGSAAPLILPLIFVLVWVTLRIHAPGAW